MGLIYNNDLCSIFTESKGKIKACSKGVDKNSRKISQIWNCSKHIWTWRTMFSYTLINHSTKSSEWAEEKHNCTVLSKAKAEGQPAVNNHAQLYYFHDDTIFKLLNLASQMHAVQSEECAIGWAWFLPGCLYHPWVLDSTLCWMRPQHEAGLSTLNKPHSHNSTANKIEQE